MFAVPWMVHPKFLLVSPIPNYKQINSHDASWCCDDSLQMTASEKIVAFVWGTWINALKVWNMKIIDIIPCLKTRQLLPNPKTDLIALGGKRKTRCEQHEAGIFSKRPVPTCPETLSVIEYRMCSLGSSTSFWSLDGFALPGESDGDGLFFEILDAYAQLRQESPGWSGEQTWANVSKCEQQLTQFNHQGSQFSAHGRSPCHSARLVKHLWTAMSNIGFLTHQTPVFVS